MHRSRSKQDRHCTCNVTQTLSGKHCCSGTAISVIHPECVFAALGFHREMCMCHNIVCGLPGSTIFFHIFSLTARFSKNVLLDMKCAFWFSLRLSTIFLVIRRTERNMIKDAYWSSCKMSVILVEFSRHIFEKYSNFMKIPPVGAELFYADRRTDGQTDMTNLIVAFGNFAEALKNLANRVKTLNC